MLIDHFLHPGVALGDFWTSSAGEQAISSTIRSEATVESHHGAGQALSLHPDGHVGSMESSCRSAD